MINRGSYSFREEASQYQRNSATNNFSSSRLSVKPIAIPKQNIFEKHIKPRNNSCSYIQPAKSVTFKGNIEDNQSYYMKGSFRNCPNLDEIEKDLQNTDQDSVFENYKNPKKSYASQKPPRTNRSPRKDLSDEHDAGQASMRSINYGDLSHRKLAESTPRDFSPYRANNPLLKSPAYLKQKQHSHSNFSSRENYDTNSKSTRSDASPIADRSSERNSYIHFPLSSRDPNTSQNYSQPKKEQRHIISIQKKTNPRYISASDMKNLMKRDLVSRIVFLEGEILNEDLSETIDFKNIYVPFNENTIKKIKQTICGFLNRKGGRIFLGITENRQVIGMRLTKSQRYSLESDITSSYLTSFEPEIAKQNLVKVLFIPVAQEEDKDYSLIPGKFVVKIIVSRGNPSELYSITKEFPLSYVKTQGSIKVLNSEMYKKELRARLTKRPSYSEDDSFSDQEPPRESIIDIEN